MSGACEVCGGVGCGCHAGIPLETQRHRNMADHALGKVYRHRTGPDGSYPEIGVVEVTNARRALAAELARVSSLEQSLQAERERTEKAEAFKAYVHRRLDGMGVPADPDPEGNARHGCRIHGRLDFLIARAESAERRLADLERLIKTAGDALQISIDTPGDLIAHVEMLRDGLAESEAGVAQLREALTAHVEQFGGSDHHPDDCDFDTEGGQRDCGQCVVASMVGEALAHPAGRDILEELERAKAFKAYVHKRLDEAGVPANPEPEKNAQHGCRIEGRLNFLLADLERKTKAIDEAIDLATSLAGMAEAGAGFVEHWGERVLQVVRPLRAALAPAEEGPDK